MRHSYPTPDFTRQVRTSTYDEKKQEPGPDNYALGTVAVGDWVWVETASAAHSEDGTPSFVLARPQMRQVTQADKDGSFYVERAPLKGRLPRTKAISPITGHTAARDCRVRIKASAEEVVQYQQAKATEASARAANEAHQRKPEMQAAAYLVDLGAYSPEQMLERYGVAVIKAVAMQLGWQPEVGGK